MGPKAKPGKGKPEPPSKPEIDPKEIVTELEKEFFEFQLADIEKKLNRISAREEELTSGKVELEVKIEEYRKEKGAVVAEHEQLLAQKDEEKNRKREEMLFLSEEVKIRIEKHKKRIQNLEREYEEMVMEYTTKLEEIEEELRAVEDYKENKDLYHDQLNKLNETMEEAEMQHQRNLFEINVKFEKAKMKVKKELQAKLLQLSIEFRQTSQRRIGQPCHRVTQENKAIQTALIQMKEETLEYEEKYRASLLSMRHCKNTKNQKQEENDKVIARTVIQVYVIKTLREQKLALLKKLKEFDAVDTLNRNLWKKLNAVTAEVHRTTIRIADVKQDIENKQEDTNAMQETSLYLKKSSRRLRMLIRNSLKLAEEAMAVRLIPMGVTEEEKYLTFDVKMNLFKKRRDNVFSRRGRILQYLFECLSNAQLSDEDKKLLTTSSDTFDVEELNFGLIYGKAAPEKEIDKKDSLLGEEEDQMKGPLFYTSLTSLPRSLSSTVLTQGKPSESESESYEGEFEEYDGEDYKEVMGEMMEDMMGEMMGEMMEMMGEEEEEREERPEVRAEKQDQENEEERKSGGSAEN